MASQSQIKDFENFSIIYQNIIPLNQIALLSDVKKKHFRTVLKILKFWHLISTLHFHKSHENDEMLVKSLIFWLDFEQFWGKTQD